MESTNDIEKKLLPIRAKTITFPINTAIHRRGNNVGKKKKVIECGRRKNRMGN